MFRWSAIVARLIARVAGDVSNGEIRWMDNCLVVAQRRMEVGAWIEIKVSCFWIVRGPCPVLEPFTRRAIHWYSRAFLVSLAVFHLLPFVPSKPVLYYCLLA